MFSMSSHVFKECWFKHPIPLLHINLNKILYNGQSFRWKWHYCNSKTQKTPLIDLLDEQNIQLETNLNLKIHYNSIYLMDINKYFPIKLAQYNDDLFFCLDLDDAIYKPNVELFLTNMLQLSIDRLSLYKEISKLDRNLETLLNPHFIEQDFTKLECTIMKLDPWETLLSFICSSNNNITRISSMCESLCVIGGKKLTEMLIPIFEENPDTGELDFLENEIQPVYAFPSSELLFQKCQENSDPVEALKKLKFGYRAKYIINTIEKFLELKKVSGKATDAEFLLQNISPLNDTKKIDYAFAKYWLMQFSGVGPKVADCILLYSDISTLYKVKKEEVELELISLTSTIEENMWNSIIPFDAHITRIALRDFPHIIKKSNSKNLELMKEDLMNQFGVYGGWIQVLLFTKEIEKNKS